MQYWEKRYERGSAASSRVEHNRLDRIKTLAIILLAVMFIGTCIVCVQAVGFRNDCGDIFVNRMKVECSTAVSLANTLSRSGGSDSAAVLGKIRANVHAVEMVNDMKQNLTGSNYVDAVTFTNLYGIIDGYLAKLKSSSAVIDEQTELINQLSALQMLLQPLN